MTLAEKIEEAIRDVPDFPRPGIVFKDITPILLNAQLCEEITEEFSRRFYSSGIDAIVGIESRGFLFGMSLAMRLGLPFIPARKKGKLPYNRITASYELEYGKAEIELHEDAIQPGWRILVHDDLLATGGTAAAVNRLVEQLKGKTVAYSFLIELSFLNGRKQLQHSGDVIVDSLIQY